MAEERGRGGGAGLGQGRESLPRKFAIPSEPSSTSGSFEVARSPLFAGRRGPAGVGSSGGVAPSSNLHRVVLVVAAAADFGAFYQVVARVMPDSADFLVYLVISGFTGIVLYLAHVAGLMVRRRTAQYERVASSTIALCLSVLALLGGVAFYVRLITPTAAARSSAGFGSASPLDVAETTGNLSFASAAVFLALYLGTAVVAGVGSYLTHNPLRDEYAAADRFYRRQSAVAATAESVYLHNEALRASAVAHRNAVRQIELAQRERVLAFAEELKRLVHVRAMSDQYTPVRRELHPRDDMM